MGDITESKEFRFDRELPRFSLAAPVDEVLATLARSGAGGFLAASGGEPAYFISGRQLAEAAVALGQSGRSAAELRNADTLSVSHLTIGELRRSGALQPIPIARQRIANSAAIEQVESGKVFQVEEDGRTIGWFLPAGISTTPLTYVCVNGHRNPDWNGGHCRLCPFPIVEVLTQP